MAFVFAIAASPVHGAMIYTTTLSGAAEAPAGSTDTGIAALMLNGSTLDVGIATPFVGIPGGLASWWTYAGSFDHSNAAVYLPAFLDANGGTATSAEAALIAALNTGTVYVSIQTSAFPGAAIGGYQAASASTSVPEPSTLLLGGSMLAAIAFLKRR
jgi:hypothetical protein